MDRYYSQVIGTTVLTTSGGAAGRVFEIVIDPATGKIHGFLLGNKGENVIAPADILFWEDQLFIQDEEDVLETHEIIKVQEILKLHIPILHSRVYTQKGKFLGKVYDIGLNPRMFVLSRIVVAKNILGLFPYDEKIIARGDILEITAEKVIVRDLEAKVTEKEKATGKKSLRIDISPSTMEKL